MMETNQNDKLSIKNLLFTKAIPNYEIPVPVNGHKLYNCLDCGDKFIFESSYNYHINRKSVQIMYTCRHCNQTKIFYNRCKLLSHIRSHAFKTATINVNDLKLDLLPLGSFLKVASKQDKTVSQNPSSSSKPKPVTICYECKRNMENVGVAFKDRAHHFMQYTNELNSCPICLFTLPTICGLRAHLRIHLRIPPYFCPECGAHLLNKNIQYPFIHDCEGFKMIRATTRLKCPVSSCGLLHPNDFKTHMKENHLKKVFKCPFCVVACFNEETMEKHLKGHNVEMNKALIFHQCEVCPGRLVVQRHVDNHMSTHATSFVFPCLKCGLIYNNVPELMRHHAKKHDEGSVLKNACPDMLEELCQPKTKQIFRVVKRCENCKRNFTYKCKYNEIPILPNECPYKCTSKLISKDKNMITCHLCKAKVSQNWGEIKKHYAKKHKNHRCLDAKLKLKKINVQTATQNNTKYPGLRRTIKSKKRRNKEKLEENKHDSEKPSSNTANEIICKLCNYKCDTKQVLEKHLIIHRDPCMAYQCLECGQSFVVKPSFSKHLLLEHNVSDVEEYIRNKECYNENALEKYQDNNISNEPLKDNQCKICREQFENAEDLEKHFRGHGMAFLLKRTSSKTETG